MKLTLVALIVILGLIASIGMARASQRLSDWKDVDELQTFLESDNTSETFFPFSKDGVTYLTIPAPNECWLRARQLEANAERQGKRLSIEIIDYDWYFQLFGRAPVGKILHAMNLAVVDNRIYFVEPSTDKLYLISGTD